jgi:hypothetical protein
MGQARARLKADASGIPRPRDPWCPACRSRSIAVIKATDFPPDIVKDAGIDCDWHTCLDCKAIWEPFPPLYVRDVVCAEPCDNCAFRPGSPEQRDPERWAELMVSLKAAGYDGQGWFYCHKGTPIDMSKGPGNFLFPKRPLTIDGDPVRNPDGTIKMIEDTSRMRTCVGFLRMLWARRAKAESEATI